jgi:hypothetical protein
LESIRRQWSKKLHRRQILKTRNRNIIIIMVHHLFEIDLEEVEGREHRECG